MNADVCRCPACVALLELAASAERNLQARRADRKLRIVRDPKRKVAA